MSVNVGRRRFVKGSAGAVLATAAGKATVAAGAEARACSKPSLPDESIELWPASPPGMPDRPPQEAVIERSQNIAMPDRALTGISRPRLDVFRPAEPNGAAVVIFPGGGYQRVVIDKEGYELGRWLAARGFVAVVLFYRLPGDGWAAGPDVALSDAQRAMRVFRNRAATFGVDPARVAALGFSAGGHLCADLATRFATQTYTPVDEADRDSARPQLAAPIYPVISMHPPVAHAGSRERLLGASANQDVERRHSPQYNVSDATPPCFLVHAEDDDAVTVANTLVFRAALRAQGVSVETHLFTHGGHGFGLRRAAGKPAHIWPELFVNWARSQGL
jgi:acetyl esterase/lipase